MTRGDKEHTFAVLFVDDEEKAQKYFRMAYANDFPVLTAGSVPEALEVLENRAAEIAVLITDQRMPGQQGVDLLKRVREDWPGIVRILTTAYSDLDDAIAAVNRGEILRYVTKPWDIQALRVDLRHAMDFFLLRQERDLLMAEKLSVRRSIVHSDRLLSLLAIAGGLARLRYAPYAVAGCVRDALGGPAPAQPAAADLELWGLEVQETLGLSKIHRKLRSLDDSVGSGFPDRADLAELLRGAGLAVEGRAGEVAMQHNLISSLVSVLAQLSGQPATALLEQGQDSAGNRSWTVTVTGPAFSSSPFTGDLDADGPIAALLEAYLITWHHGGALITDSADGRTRFVLTLPEDPSAVLLPEPDEDWLADQFSMMEHWE